MAKTILLVCADRHALALREKAVGPLADKVYVATSFPQAKNILMEAKPDVLVTDLRLNEFNGIHLALWSRVRLPHLRSIIVGFTDPSLAGDARSYGFDYLQEESPEAIVDHTQQALERQLPQRRSPRKPLSFPLSAEIDGLPAELFDAGHGGFRVLIAEGGPEPGTTFILEIRELGIRVAATCLWEKRLGGTARWCGAALAESESGPEAPWRAFVDALLADAAFVPGSTPS